MNNTQLYIPKKCKVGFNLRSDTYTGKLGYIIYNDGKVWRKETSWETWRHKEGGSYSNWDPKTRTNVKGVYDETINPIEFDNVPTEGFVLNKKVGGHSSGWNHRQTYSRVYDPRGWEFEITVPNLLYILQECSSFKGKGLEGEFVYSWDGKDVVLLPVSSPDYVACEEYTDLQSKKVGKKDLTLGCTYLTSKMEKLIYLGRYDACVDTWYNRVSFEGEGRATFEPKYVFKHANGRLNKYSGQVEEGTYYEFLSGLGRIKSKLTEVAHPEFASYVEELEKSDHISRADHLEVVPFKEDFWKSISWDTCVYIYGKINNSDDLVWLKRRIRNSSDGKYELYKYINRNSYNYRGDSIPEETLTKEEVEAKYGCLMRVYKSGLKKYV